MHFEDPAAAKRGASNDDGPWWKELTRYQWFVFIVASLGWLFDTMDQQLFTLARKPAITELLTVPGGALPSSGSVAEQTGIATMIFMIGWALGGILFGILGDRIGRAKTMMLTVLCYSAFTGLSRSLGGRSNFRLFSILVRPGRRRTVRGRRCARRGGDV